MAPPIQHVSSDRALPARVDAVVIGGGIIGVCTAYHLAKKGIAVAVCEKGVIAGEQSSRNWGWCRTMGRDLAEIPLSVESLRMWATMNEDVGAETGFRRTGIVYLCETKKDVDGHAAWLARTLPYQVDARLLDRDEVAKLLPISTRRWSGGLVAPHDGIAEPSIAAPAIAEAARRFGANIFTSCAVRGVETTGGAVSAVVTEQGRIACGAVILAGGAWSSLFCGAHGIHFPQLKILASVMRAAPVKGAPLPAVGASDFAFRRQLDGGYTIAQRGANIAPIVPDSFRLFFEFLPAAVKQWRQLRLRIGRRFVEEWKMPRSWPLDGASPFETIRILDPEPTTSILSEAEANLTRDFPIFKGATITDRWAGLIDVTPDAIPVISPVPSLPGFFIASGFSGHGFGIAPAAGKLMAELVTGHSTIVDPAPFRMERLANASPLSSGLRNAAKSLRSDA